MSVDCRTDNLDEERGKMVVQDVIVSAHASQQVVILQKTCFVKRGSIALSLASQEVT